MLEAKEDATGSDKFEEPEKETAETIDEVTEEAISDVSEDVFDDVTDESPEYDMVDEIARDPDNTAETEDVTASELELELKPETVESAEEVACERPLVDDV